MSEGAFRVLGIDGGGTGSRACLTDGKGQCLQREVGGAALVRPGAEGDTVHVLADLVSRTMDGAGTARPLDRIVAGLAGVGREGTRLDMERRLMATGLARQVRVLTDVEVAFHDAFGSGPGILLIAGTGSVAMARLPSGGIARTGGWGALVGDEGSGWWLGIAGLRAALRGRDGRGPRTILSETLPASMGYPGSSALVHHLWGVPKAEVAALAPRVVEAADGGDAVAGALVEEAVRGIVEHLKALRKEWPTDERPPLALLGGLIVPGGPLRSRLLERLHDEGIRPKEAPPDGARGAAALAREHS